MSLPSKELSDSALDALIARERTRIVAPLTDWRALSAQLRQEGLVQDAPRASVPEQPFPTYTDAPRQRSGVYRWGVRFLAGVFLVGSGVAVGRSITLGSELVPIITTAVEGERGDSLNMHLSTKPGDFGSTAAAKRSLTKSTAQAQHAAAFLATHDSLAPVLSSPEAYQERLRALDEMMAAGQRAMQVAPADPVINQYYLATFGARQRTVQQMNRLLKPVGARLTGY